MWAPTSPRLRLEKLASSWNWKQLETSRKPSRWRWPSCVFVNVINMSGHLSNLLEQVNTSPVNAVDSSNTSLEKRGNADVGRAARTYRSQRTCNYFSWWLVTFAAAAPSVISASRGQNRAQEAHEPCKMQQQIAEDGGGSHTRRNWPRTRDWCGGRRPLRRGRPGLVLFRSVSVEIRARKFPAFECAGKYRPLSARLLCKTVAIVPTRSV